MLTIFRWTALFAAIVLTVALVGTVLSSKPSIEPSQEQTPEKNQGKQPNEESSKTLWDRWFPDSISLYTLFLVVFTAVLALGGLIQLNLLGRAEGVATKAANAAKQSAVIAERALVAGQRAFVHLDEITFEVADNWVSHSESGPGIIVYNIPQNVGKMIRSKFSFTNAGNTPTKSLKIMLHCQLVGPGTQLGDPFDLLKWDETKVIHRSMGAKQTITVSVDTCNLRNNDVLLNAQMRIVPVFLIGELKYEDWIEPGKVHRTQFAHRLVVYDTGRDDAFTGISVATEPVGSHNCTDEDCPQ